MALHTVVAGSGPRIVLVHGFAQTQACWGEAGDALASDHEVVRVDAPGHGGSADVRADLAGTADLLADSGGPATYLGYSMGGRMVLHLALTHPQVVRGMVLVGATAGVDDPIEREARQVADDALAVAIEVDGMDAFLDRWLALPLFAGLDEHTAFRTERLANTTDGLASSLRLAGTGQQEPVWDRLGAITAPTLVVAGADDEKFGALGRRIADGIGANATFEAVPGAGHSAHLEQPDAFLDVLRPWLAREGL
jgi:2-succinyl-6-hydroxy-2,4-cyclohexadiene-1-carboxylate synthase